MVIPREYFPVTNRLGLRTGDRVLALSRPWKQLPADMALGCISLIWLGLEETIEIVDDETGQRYSFYPDMGDQIVVLP